MSIWMTLVVSLAADVEGVAGIPAGTVGLLEPRADGKDIVGVQAGLVDQFWCPRTRSCPAPAGDRRAAPPCPSANVQPAGPYARRTLRSSSLTLLPAECRRRHRRPGFSALAKLVTISRAVSSSIDGFFSARVFSATRSKLSDGMTLAENIHRHVDQHRAGLAAFGQVERLFQDFGHQFGPVHPPGAFHEGAVDFPLRRVGVQVDLLVRVLAVVMRRNIAGDDHHRDAIERGIGHAGGAIRQARATGATAPPRPCPAPAHRHRRHGWRSARGARSQSRWGCRPGRPARRYWCGPQRPKTCFTSRRSRKSTICSATVLPVQLCAVHYATSRPKNSPNSSSSEGRSSGIGRLTQV